MPTLDNLATRFAHCVSLFRDPTAKAEQKKEFRALLGLLQDTAVTLRLAQGGSGIEVNDVPCEGEGVAVLVERLDLHGIGEIALPANPPPAQLFELLQALADQPGAHDVTSRLAAAGAAQGGGRAPGRSGSRVAAQAEWRGRAAVTLERAAGQTGTSACRANSSSLRCSARSASLPARPSPGRRSRGRAPSRCGGGAHRSRGAATRCRRRARRPREIGRASCRDRVKSARGVVA